MIRKYRTERRRAGRLRGGGEPLATAGRGASYSRPEVARVRRDGRGGQNAGVAARPALADYLRVVRARLAPVDYL